MTRTLYTPVLRWKPAEQWALAKLSQDQREGIRPLIEAMPSKSKGHVSVSISVARSIIGSWGVRREFLLDFSQVAEIARVGNVIGEISALRDAGAMPRVVVPVRRSAFAGELSEWLASQLQYRCSIRVGNASLASTTLQRDVAMAVASIKRRPQDVEVLLDFGAMTDGTSMQRTAELLAKSERWASVTIIGGSFPRDLTGLKKNDQYLLPRSEWLSWESLDRRAISASCSFGDYTVVSADYREAPPNANFSASLRYTTNRDFVVMRGEGVYNDEGAGFHQYPAQAEMLRVRTEYCGAEFSAGDKYIYEMSRQTTDTGSAQTWLRAGINHHIVFVKRQLAA